jgi:hypothetical protein
MRPEFRITLYEFAVDRVPQFTLNHNCDGLVVLIAGHQTNPLLF